jgi:phosphoglycolate phosphatase
MAGLAGCGFILVLREKPSQHGLMNVTVVLFDIDGTLLDMKGAGRLAFAQTIKTVFGIDDDLAYLSFAGSTDLSVLQKVMEHHVRRLTETDSRRFFERMPAELEQAATGSDLVLYPGVRPLLERLSSRRDVILGLVTGNIAACAQIKLRQFNLHHHFVLGAFGDEHADRKEIARLAMSRVQARLTKGAVIHALYLVGDTPNDVEAAKAIDAVAIAVATGKYAPEALQQAGADVVLSDMGDTDCVMQLFALPPP